MKQKSSFVLDKEDGKVVQLFAGLGMPKNLAKTLTYISQVDECRSADVEKSANLRQPEVSIAMQELRNRGWAEVQSFKKKKGKGRPIHIYKATMSLSQVMEEIEQEKTKEIEAVKDNMLELKNIFNNR
jgi:predicted transcriptional regulator